MSITGRNHGVLYANRIYALHNSISTEQFSEDMLSLISERLKRTDNYETSSSFLDDISDKELLRALLDLKHGDLEMVETCLIDGMTHEEYALCKGKSRPSITRKLGRIKAKLAAGIKD